MVSILSTGPSLRWPTLGLVNASGILFPIFDVLRGCQCNPMYLCDTNETEMRRGVGCVFAVALRSNRISFSGHFTERDYCSATQAP